MAGKEGTVFVVDGEEYLFDFEAFNESFRTFRRKILYYSVTEVEKLIAEGKVLSSWAVSYGGVSEAIAKMAFGNRIGFRFTDKLSANELYRHCYGAFVLELAEGTETDERVIGETTEAYRIEADSYTIDAEKLQKLVHCIFPPYTLSIVCFARSKSAAISRS